MDERHNKHLQELLVKISNFFTNIRPILVKANHKKECREIDALIKEIRMWNESNEKQINRKNNIEWALRIIKCASTLYNLLRPFWE